MESQSRTPIDWRWADRRNLTDEGLRAAIAGTLANEPGAADVLAARFTRRCVEKIVIAACGKYPDIPKHDVENLVEEKAGDVVMEIQAGKLTEFRESPSNYLFIAVDHAIKDSARKKKGHEVPFSQLSKEDLEPKAGGLHAVESTEAFLATLVPPRARPHRIVIRREMVRALAAQVGRLPRQLREVAARTREGKENNQIAMELGITEATVRSHYKDAEDTLKKWLDSSGAVSAWFLQRKPPLVAESHRGVQRDLVTTFLTSLSEECWRAFNEVHLNGKRISETRKVLGACRAGTEALLAYAYWAMFRKAGFLFPRDFLRTILPPHPVYPDHNATFTYW